jgi:hypothetical protein
MKRMIKKITKFVKKGVYKYMNKEKEIMETKLNAANDFIHDDEAIIKVGIGLISIGIGMVSSVFIKRNISLA